MRRFRNSPSWRALLRRIQPASSFGTTPRLQMYNLAHWMKDLMALVDPAKVLPVLKNGDKQQAPAELRRWQADPTSDTCMSRFLTRCFMVCLGNFIFAAQSAHVAAAAATFAGLGVSDEDADAPAPKQMARPKAIIYQVTRHSSKRRRGQVFEKRHFHLRVNGRR